MWTSLILVALAATSERFCDKPAPQPVAFYARGFGYVVEIFPPSSRRNSGSRPLAYFYEVGYPGSQWRNDARRLWVKELANPLMPEAAIVSPAGHVVTLDDYHYDFAAEHAIVLYDVGGRFVRSYTIDQLLDSTDLARVP